MAKLRYGYQSVEYLFVHDLYKMFYFCNINIRENFAKKSTPVSCRVRLHSANHDALKW